MKDRTDTPKWFRNRIKAGKAPVSISLHAARSVRVSAVAGSRCDTN